MNAWLREQVSYIVLAYAMVVCDTVGHEEPVTIMWNGDIARVCPRCGADA